MAITLEIDCFGMKKVADDHFTLAQNREEVEFWDVTLVRRNDETGEIEELEDHSGLSGEESMDKVEDIERRYPDAEVNDPWPS
jgi:hypothetical protein